MRSKKKNITKKTNIKKPIHKNKSIKVGGSKNLEDYWKSTFRTSNTTGANKNDVEDILSNFFHSIDLRNLWMSQFLRYDLFSEPEI